MRFYRRARALIDTGSASDGGPVTGGAEPTLGEFLARERFSPYFISHFMTPVVSAVWSCDPTTALSYPARYLFTFLGHHGLLGVKGSPQWRTVTGGSGQYVEKLAATLPDIRLNSPVTAIRRHALGVEVDTAEGIEDFEAVVIATHPAQALGLLADATPAEKEALGAMPYSVNHTVFHRDPAVLPAADNARASWNYRLPGCDARPDKVLVSYDLTRLQRLKPADGRPYLVSLGESELIKEDGVLERMVYEHPQYTPESLRAQQQIAALSDDRIAYAGAYLGWGFHEDGALSGVRAAASLGRTWDAPGVEGSGTPADQPELIAASEGP
jgi:predicted NAD/FAD-binding protein